MEIISSNKNEKIKNILALQKSKKERDEQGVFAVEGMRIVRDILSDSPGSVTEIFVSESFYNTKKDDIPDTEAHLHVVKDSVFRTMSETVSPQGVMAIVKRKQYALEEILLRSGRILVLENIQDPGNLGTMLRTAEAAGMSGLLLSRGCADIYNPKVIRSTMGSVMRVPFVYCDDFSEALRKMKSEGVTIYGAYLHGGKSFKDVSFNKKYAIMIGNEGNGLTDEAIALADERIYIPMQGKIESLNASVAAAILMYA